jgi:hypothetical protein
VDLYFEPDGRLSSIEFYSNPDQWAPSRLDELPSSLPPVWLRFRVELDENAIGGFDCAAAVAWDVVSRTLALRFGDAEPARWYAAADTVAIAADTASSLCEIRLLNAVIG